MAEFEADPDDILEELLEIWERLYPIAVEEFRMRGEGSLQQLEVDYAEAVEKFRERHEATDGDFALYQLGDILPDNSWVRWQFRKFLEIVRRNVM